VEMKNIAAVVCVALLVGCSVGYKMPTGPDRYAAVPAEQVEILFAPPNRPYKQIGLVSAEAYYPTTAMYAKLRKAAADLGAYAVIVTSSTAANYYTYPTGQGIAIKYLR
jgi:hypothetical protein